MCLEQLGISVKKGNGFVYWTAILPMKDIKCPKNNEYEKVYSDAVKENTHVKYVYTERFVTCLMILGLILLFDSVLFFIPMRS